MASDLTPEEIASMRKTLDSGNFVLLGEDGYRLLDMAERCADYDRRLSEVMPKDFKDWHQNGPKEWPEVAAGTITNLRERLEQAEEKASTYDRLRESQHRQWSSITRDIVKAQNKQGDA